MKDMAVKKIYLPTDFSKSSRNAVHYAVGLFGLKGVEYTLLNCYAMPATGAEMLISLTDILRVESEEGLEKEKAALIAEIPGLKPVLKTRCENGQLENILHRLRKSDRPDIVVMGTTGATGFMKALWGSTTASVLKRTQVPVLAVPGDFKFKRPKNIALALQREMSRDFLYPSMLVDFISKYDSEVSVVSVEEEPVIIPASEVKAVANGSGGRAFPAQRYNIYESNPVRGIMNFIKNHRTDMLVMVAREYGFIKSMFHHSTTREMAMISKVPLLVLRERN